MGFVSLVAFRQALQNAVIAGIFLNLGSDCRDLGPALLVYAADGRNFDPDPHR